MCGQNVSYLHSSIYSFSEIRNQKAGDIYIAMQVSYPSIPLPFLG